MISGVVGTSFRIFAVLLVIGVFFSVVFLDVETLMGANKSRVEPAQVSDASSTRGGPQNSANDDADQTLVFRSGPRGHYVLNAEVNGESIRFLVDTGATVVALSAKDAERLGYDEYSLEFTGRTMTANGPARVARVMLDEISVGDITVRDVQAVVLERPMRVSLLGMSFLKKLKGFEVKGNELILRW